VARDILSRGLDDSLAYARHERARWALVIGEPSADAEQLRVIPLDGKASERRVAAAEVLADPARFFPDIGGRR